MNFVYGSNSWENLSDGQKNCYLLTNGLGGFSSLAMLGSNTRNDHALLMACLNTENKRLHLVTNVSEVLVANGEQHFLSSQEHVNKLSNKDGYKYLNSFCFEKFPEWFYQVDGVEIYKTVAMRHGRNCVAVKYQVVNRTTKLVSFEATPHLQFVVKGDVLKEEQKFEAEKDSITSNGIALNFKTNGTLSVYEQEFVHDLYYSYDERDGREAIGAAAHNHKLTWNIAPGKREDLYLIYDLETIDTTVEAIFENESKRLDSLVKQSNVTGEVARQLVISADQFIIEKTAIDGKTIVAGYPFFMDWGRDTMIALSGCCISTQRYDITKTILRSFMKYCKNGLMPNMFPEGGSESFYNTVDASLLFINVLYEYYEACKDLEFIKEAYETASDIIEWYMRGTDYHIRMDDDGLIMAGAEYEQVTWMDVRYKDILPTPRHGKPVEINAYWYSALKIMAQFSELLGLEKSKYEKLAEKVKESFCKEFWLEDKGYLKDLVSGTNADTQIRCNQIWAVSAPFTMLSEKQQIKVVDVVFEHLYTPYGLRSLSKDDTEFHSQYCGSLFDRDMAYHQGTVWGFPLGAYYLAYLKAHENSAQAIQDVKRQLTAIESTMREGCIGQIAEIFDGEHPTVSRGCFAQAWSVGEVLKVLKRIELLEGN